MKFAHISDTHLGQTQYHEQEREDDMYRALKEAADIAIRDHVDFVVLSGDLFDKPSPSGRAIVAFAKILKHLKNSDIKTYFILGEHDISRIRETPVAHVYDRLGVATHIGDGIPIKHKNVLLVGFDKMRSDELPHHEDRFAEIDAVAKQHDGHRILVMHQGVTEVNKFAGEIAVGDMPKTFSYYAMGHLHNRFEKRFDALGGILAYPGSTEITSVEGIHGTKKGFYEVDISTNEATMQCIGLDTRPHLVFDVEYANLASHVNKIATEIMALEKRPVVKINISGSSIDVGMLHETSTPIRDVALYLKLVASRTETNDDGEVINEKPVHMDVERTRLTEKALGDNTLSKFALEELLPLLSAGKIEEALKLVYSDYEKFRKGRIK